MSERTTRHSALIQVSRSAAEMQKQNPTTTPASSDIL